MRRSCLTKENVHIGGEEYIEMGLLPTPDGRMISTTVWERKLLLEQMVAVLESVIRKIDAHVANIYTGHQHRMFHASTPQLSPLIMLRKRETPLIGCSKRERVYREQAYAQ